MEKGNNNTYHIPQYNDKNYGKDHKLEINIVLRKKQILSKEQSGFRHIRSTMKNLITIKTEIENIFEHKQILGMISLDITKAYDFVWRHRILTLLSKILTNSNMFMYITNFLKERQFIIPYLIKDVLPRKWHPIRIISGSYTLSLGH